MSQSHKPFNGLKFTNSVPKFLQTAIAKHGINKSSFIAKKFVSEDGDNDEIKENDETTANSSEEKPERMTNGDRKDTEFEKPVIVNVEHINDLNMKQREQLNDIMRKSQMKEIKNTNNKNEDEEDEDLFIAKKVMGFASVPSQNVIGMEKKHKAKFKFTKKKIKKHKKETNNNTTNSLLGKRKLFNHNDEDGNNMDNDGVPQKKRKIYQEMSRKQLKKQRKKKLKFKSTVTCNTDKTDSINTQTLSSMLSFDPDEE